MRAKLGLRIESTPLYLARLALVEAEDDIESALEAWSEENDGLNNYPGGDYDLTLRPDSASLGFEALFVWSETSAPTAHELTARLHDVFVKHGIATVSVADTGVDSDGPVEFNE